MTKQQFISAEIIKLVADGKTISEAVDAVLGVGTYERLAGEIYDALKGGVR